MKIEEVFDNLPEVPTGVELGADALPTLVGTPKQVAWAEKIRSEMIPNLFSYAMTRTSDGRVSNMIDTVVKGKEAMMKSIEEEIDNEYTSQTVKEEIIERRVAAFNDAAQRFNLATQIALNDSAVFWIDHRENQPKNLRGKRIHAIIDGKEEL